jgi:HEAT repeat protein
MDITDKTQIKLDLGIFITDPDLRVVTWNQWMSRNSGIPESQAIGKKIQELFPDLEKNKILSRFQKVINQGSTEVLSSAFHKSLFKCKPSNPALKNSQMLQHVCIVPLIESNIVQGCLVTIEEITGDHSGNKFYPHKDLASQDSIIKLMQDQDWHKRHESENSIITRANPDIIGNIVQIIKYHHKDINILNCALSILAKSEIDASTALEQLLTDNDPDVRIYAALALASQKNPKAVELLIKALSDDNENVVFQAIESLGKLKAAESVPFLLNIANSENTYLANAAIEALANIKDPRIIPMFLKLLNKPSIQIPVIQALSTIGTYEAIEPLTKLLDLETAPVNLIIKTLDAIYSKYEFIFGEGNFIIDQFKNAISPYAVKKLTTAHDQLNTSELQSWIRVISWLQNQDAYKALAEMLGNEEIRNQAIDAFARNGRHFTDILIDQLYSENPIIRESAVIALGKIGTPKAVPHLIKLLNEDSLIIQICAALARIGDQSAFKPVLPILGHPDKTIRHAAIAVINSLGHPDTAKELSALLQSNNPFTRESAVRIAGYFGYREFISQILELFDDPVESVKRAVVESLPFFDSEKAIQLLKDAASSPSPQIRSSAAYALGFLPISQSGNSLLKLLADPNPWVKYYTIKSLTKLRCPEALSHILNISINDESPFVKIAAIAALGELGGNYAIAHLAKLTSDPDINIACEAINALSKISHPDSIQPLIDSLRSKIPSIRKAAIQAMATKSDPEVIQLLQWKAVSESDLDLCAAAMNSLLQIGTEESIQALIDTATNPKTAKLSISTIAKIPKSKIHILRLGIRHPNPEARKATIISLAMTKEPTAVDLIIQATTDHDPSVKSTAVSLLNDLGYTIHQKPFSHQMSSTKVAN